MKPGSSIASAVNGNLNQSSKSNRRGIVNPYPAHAEHNQTIAAYTTTPRRIASRDKTSLWTGISIR